MKSRRLYFLANPDKPAASEVLADLKAFASERCTVVGSQVGLDGRAAIEAGADGVVVLGGDGSLIGVARSLAADQVPIIGINVGKLGFLAEFSVEEFKTQLERILSDPDLINRRGILEVSISSNDSARSTHLAINDCVIRAGHPFRLIDLGISIDGTHFTQVSGDGLIICTPSGSTAHNLSAGGPVLQPGIDAIVLTPLCPHSLTHKPLVIERDAVIDVVADRVNEGTTAIIDGQESCPLKLNDRVSIKRYASDFVLVRNPLYAKWHKLVTKLHWGKAPNYE